MNPAYYVVNECLRELQKAKIPIIRKLQIEIELLQIKRLLLAQGEATFVADFQTFQAAFCSGCSASGVEDSTQLVSLVENLRYELVSDFIGNSRCPDASASWKVMSPG